MLVLKNGEYMVDAEKNTNEEIGNSYEERVVLLIREKYSLDEELAIQRQRETKFEEFNEYFTYCEKCKMKAKKEC